MTTPTPSQRVDEQERSASSMATYPRRVVKADFARTLAVELECAERDLAAAQSERARLVAANEHWHTRVTQEKALREQAEQELAAAQEARRVAEERAESCAKDAERLQHLIDNAYSGLNKDLEEPQAVGMVIGGKVEWPDGVRPAIDAAIAAQAGEPK